MEDNFNIFSGYDPTLIPTNIKECFAKLTLSSTKKRTKNPEVSEEIVDKSSPKPSASRKILQDLLTDDESENEVEEVNKLFLSFNSRKTFNQSDEDARTEQSTENKDNSIFSGRLEVSNTDEANSADESVAGVLHTNTSGPVLRPSRIKKRSQRFARRSEELFSQKGKTQDVVSQLSSRVDNLNIRSPPADVRQDIAPLEASTSTTHEGQAANENKRTEVALADTVTSEIIEVISSNNQRQSFPFTKSPPPPPQKDKNCEEISILTISSSVSSINRSSFNISETDNEVIEVSDSESEGNYVDNVSSIVPTEREQLPPTLSNTAADRLDKFLDDVARKVANSSQEASEGSIVITSPIKENSAISLEESLEIPETSSEHLCQDESTESSKQHSTDNKQDNSDNIKISKETEEKDLDTKHNSIKVTQDIENGIERINISATIKIKLHISQPVVTEVNESLEEISNDQEEQKQDQSSSKESSQKSTSDQGQESQHATNTSKNKHHSIKTPEKSESRTSEKDKSSEIELDENAKQILNELYGNEWQTPEILNIKKNKKIEDSCLDFTNFHKNIRSDLESTRVNLDDKSPIFKTKTVNAFKKPLKTEEQYTKPLKTPKTTRKGRKVRQRIANLDLSSTDEDFNASDDSWIETSSSSSNSGAENIPSTKRKARKKKKDNIIYLDLTNDFIQVQKEYKSPPANDDKAFNDRLKKILESCRSVDKPQLERTPTSTRTKRKLFTPRFGDEHEDLLPLNDDVEKLQLLNGIEDDIVRIKDPLPAKFELVNKQLEAVKTGTPIFSIKKVTTTTSKKNRNPTTLDTKPQSPQSSTPINSVNKKTPLNEIRQTPKDKYGFLKSLDVSVAKEFCHPDALQYRDNYKTKKDELAQKLLKMYNEKLFNNELQTSIIWNKKLTNTAGRCSNKRKAGKRFSVIELSEKVLTSADRLRCTLMHELCHAATWVFNGEHGHGSTWKSWTYKANLVFPELPKIDVCHQYDIEYKYTYKCTLCGAASHAHSKSKKAENVRCSFCHGAIEIFLNKKDKEGNRMLTPVREPVGFAKFVKEKYKLFKKPELKHADVMKLLSNEFASLSVSAKKKY